VKSAAKNSTGQHAEANKMKAKLKELD